MHYRFCHSKRSAKQEIKESKYFPSAWQYFCAKILRLAMLAQDDRLVINLQKPEASRLTGLYLYTLAPTSRIFSRMEIKSSKVAGRLLTSRNSAEGW